MSPTLIEWAKRPLHRYADFTGRASRPEYWWFMAAYMVGLVAASVVDSMMGLSGMLFGLYGPVTSLLILALLVPALAVGVRRLHDTDREGWWILLGFIPAAGLVLLYFLVLEGTAGDNRFGPPHSPELPSESLWQRLERLN